mgnify:FL=1
MSSVQDNLIAALDVGSSKVASLIARVEPDGSLTALGFANRQCLGMKNGVVVDPSAVEHAIKDAMDHAEHMAGLDKIEEIYVSCSAGSPRSRIIEVDVSIDGHEVGHTDVSRVLTTARQQINPEDGRILHAFPVAFGLDGTFSVHAPISMFGDSLSVAMHVISVNESPVKNLERVVERAPLSMSALVSSAYANGLAVLDENEVRLGTTCIDIGGGTTEISMFAEHALVHQEVLLYGGDMLTERIARKLMTPYSEAEKLKVRGSAIVDPADERSIIDVLQIGESEDGEEGFIRMPKSELTFIMQNYFEELFYQIKAALKDTGLNEVAGQNIVLTGGVAQCDGIAELATRILGSRTRIGTPKGVDAMPDVALKPQFATVVGMLIYAQRSPDRLRKKRVKQGVSESHGLFNRISGWFKNEF